MNTMPPRIAPQTAHAIASDMLEVTRQAYQSRDFDAFAACFLIPNVVQTPHATHRIETRDDLRATFDRMLENFDALGVIDMHRRITHAVFHDAETIEAHFESRHVLQGPQFGADVRSKGFLRLVDGRWRIAEHVYITNSAPLIRALTPE